MEITTSLDWSSTRDQLWKQFADIKFSDKDLETYNPYIYGSHAIRLLDNINKEVKTLSNLEIEQRRTRKLNLCTSQVQKINEMIYAYEQHMLMLTLTI